VPEEIVIVAVSDLPESLTDVAVRAIGSPEGMLAGAV
jgi:hypothetical protein